MQAQIKETSMLRVTGFFAGNSPVTDESCSCHAQWYPWPSSIYWLLFIIVYIWWLFRNINFSVVGEISYPFLGIPLYNVCFNRDMHKVIDNLDRPYVFPNIKVATLTLPLYWIKQSRLNDLKLCNARTIQCEISSWCSGNILWPPLSVPRSG